LLEIECVCSGEERSELINFAYSRTLKEHIDSWCQWFAETHPTESSTRRLVELDYWDGDSRIRFLAHPGPGARLLCFAEACYRVDNAICGTSKEAERESERLRAMDPLKYLFSEDLMAWWETDICQLFDEIEQGNSNRLVSLVRVEGISDTGEAYSPPSMTIFVFTFLRHWRRILGPCRIRSRESFIAAAM
jgi:hypothetical protein